MGCVDYRMIDEKMEWQIPKFLNKVYKAILEEIRLGENEILGLLTKTGL